MWNAVKRLAIYPKTEMLYIVFTTGACNLRCSYCGGTFDPHLVPWWPTYEIDDLVELIERDEEAVVAFYGGEPLLNPWFMEDVIRRLRGKVRFVLQTNGTLIRRVKPIIPLEMDAILLSIDGIEEVTDKYRGKGVYKVVLDAARYLREMGFKGDMIARMTATEDTDIYRDVMHLFNLGLFDHVHWQLNVVWSERWGFEGWADGSYLHGVERLAELWVSRIEEGSVLGIAPFQGIIKRYLDGGPNPPCGAGSDAVAISTDGRILACPIALEEGWAVLGRLGETKEIWPVERYPEIREGCGGCSYFRICGGRCLYTFKERLWGREGFDTICRVTRRTIDTILGRLNRIWKAVESGLVSWEEISYPKFNNTVEIIP